MSNEVSNADIYGALMGIKEDIGGLKANATLQLEGLKSHATRITALEDGAARQKGAAKVWTMVGSAVGAAIGMIGGIVAAWVKTTH